MQRLLNVSNAIQTIPAGFLKKWEPITKYPKNKLSLVTEVDEPKTSFVVWPRRWNNFIVKFQNLKEIVIIRVNYKQINVKNEQLKTEQLLNQTFFQKNLKQKSSNLSTLFASWEMFATLHTFILFYLGFLPQPFTNHRAAREEGGYSFNSSLPLPLAFTDT